METNNDWATLFGQLFFGQLFYANQMGPRGYQNLTGLLVFTYFDTGVTIFAIRGGKRLRRRTVVISCNNVAEPFSSDP